MNAFFLKHYFVLVLLTLAISARADLTMNLETEVNGERQPMTMQVSDSGMRINQKTGAVIILPAKHQMLMVDDNQKMVMVMELPEGSKTTDAPGAPVKLTKTGKKETINGFACEQFLSTDGSGQSTELWISQNGPDMEAFIEMGKSMQGELGAGPDPSMKWLDSAMSTKEISHFPIRTVTDSSKTTLVSFNTDSLPAEEFAAPAGYQTMTMPSMSGLMNQMSGLKKKSSSGDGISPEQIQALQEAAKKFTAPQ